jgi:Zn-dependent protease with chaperone function/Tfp pilus assembly protein PilE
MDRVYRHEPSLFGIAVALSGVLWFLLIVGTLGVALLYLLLGFVAYLFVHSGFIAHIKGNGVRVTEAQFPDLHRSLEACCRKIGMTTPPDMYLLRTDFFNALATKFLGRNFIVLFSDVVDALEDEPGAIDFYIGHELGHIHRKHLQWSAFLFPALLLPVLGSAYRRAQEYTCDRYGASCCTNEGQIRAALAAIAAGNTRWKTLQPAGYLAQVPQTAGFWMSFHELTNDYPWMTKRMASALAFVRNEEITHPRRNFFAAVLAIFVPRLGAGGGSLSLLVTVAVIGVLAAIAIPAYQDYVTRAKVTSALTDAEPLKAKVEDYFAVNDDWPTSLHDLGYDDDTVPTSDGSYELGVYERGIVAITLADSQYVVLEPSAEEVSITWTCYGEGANEAQLPPDCRL